MITNELSVLDADDEIESETDRDTVVDASYDLNNEG